VWAHRSVDRRRGTWKDVVVVSMRRVGWFDWESLIVGRVVPALRTRWTITALWSAFGVVRAFDRGGLTAALPRMERIVGDSRARAELMGQPVEVRLFLAREMAWRVRGPIRMRYGQRLCLFEALAATSALRAVGLPAQVVVAYATGFGAANTPVHAWADLDGHPVSDSPYVWQRYTEIACYPKDGTVRDEGGDQACA
jgi:hypothetical protein